MAEQMNADRIERVMNALSLYDDPSDLRSNIVDCIADMMHAWEQEGSDELFYGLVSSALLHFVAEQDEEKFNVGDTVYWTDPDGGLCSRNGKVVAVDIYCSTLQLADIGDETDTIVCEAHQDECTLVTRASP